MEPDDITRLTSSPIVVWIVIVIMLLGMIASAVPKVLGPIGTGIAEWSARRRAERAARIGADIADLTRENAHLEHELEAERSKFASFRRMCAKREARWRHEWHAHRHWDFAAQEALIGRQPPFDLAPPFMTPDPPEEDPSLPKNSPRSPASPPSARSS